MVRLFVVRTSETGLRPPLRMQPRVFSFINHAYATAAELLDDGVVRDGLADHAQACYGGSEGKSMKAVELADS